MSPQHSPVLRGRALEREQLGGLLERARAGESATLVVRGEAGIGKTALLDDCVEQASGFRIVRISGIESEMELPYAGLHLLCAPMLGHVHRLPDPQQNALRVAFGLSVGDVPDRFLVALAALSLLAEVALERPLLCVVDDTQWLDAASAQVFGFVARRTLAESVLLLFGIRESGDDRKLPGQPELTLAGLSDDAARELLRDATSGRIDERVRDRLIAETQGNPLALLELPRDMTTAELAGGFPVPHSTDVSAQIEEHFLRRYDALPEQMRQLVLIASADPTGDVCLLWRAAEKLGIGRSAIAEFDAEQLVDFGARVRFRHPLVRSAVYSAASPKDRRAAHVALAEAMDPETDPDRRAWHRALAAAGPDEAVAEELERSAGRAQARGGLAAAAAFLQRSAALTGDPERRADRALAAAQVQVHAGAFGEGLTLLASAEIDARSDLQHARIELLRGQIATAAGPLAEASPQLLNAARRLERLDLNLARETYLDAWAAAMYAGQSAQLRDVSRAARNAPPSPDPDRLSELLLDGVSLLVTEGRASAIPALRKAVAAFPTEAISVEKGLQWGTLAAAAAGTLWDFESMAAVLRRQSELARDAGALVPLCFCLTGEVFSIAWRGQLGAATALAAETDAVTAAIGLPQIPTGTVLLQALRGDQASDAFIRGAIDLAADRGERMAVQVGHWAYSVLLIGSAQYEQALAVALQATDGPTDHLVAWALPELIEAATRTGNQALAEDALGRLAHSTQANETDWGRGIFARSTALVAKGDRAEEQYQRAIEWFERTALRPEQARSHLVYGEWLRGMGRGVDAREQLHKAHDMFSEIGMLGFTECALRELRATGESVRRRDEDTNDNLTPQEGLIARLARDGRTNSEIGAQLFLSPRTVEWHLRKVFTKLGVTSRGELRGALPERENVSG
jgi:DNA-binding CsgD family transcriptional regulator/tetratricopeptide (TPR) repeat protein